VRVGGAGIAAAWGLLCEWHDEISVLERTRARLLHAEHTLVSKLLLGSGGRGAGKDVGDGSGGWGR
jgi:hypothetical protein